LQVDGQVLGSGTGFVANSAVGPVLMTNLHIVTGIHPETGIILSPTGGVPNEILIHHNLADHLGQWIPRTESLLENGEPRWLRHPRLGPETDFVALPLRELNDTVLFPHSLGLGDPLIVVGPAEKVSVVGFPFGIRTGGSLALWTTGYVASEPQIDHDGRPIFLIDCRARPGQSGSPVIAQRSGGMLPLEDGSSKVFSGPVSRFLGIYSGRINPESDLGIVWKAEVIKELVASLSPDESGDS